MVPLKQLEEYLSLFLKTGEIHDMCPNGLQVEGRDKIHRIVTGVSICEELIQAAVRKNADAVIVHHGLFWDNASGVVKGSLRTRLKILLQNEISLLAYHLPLDCHPKVGNNAQLVERLGLTRGEPFGKYKGTQIGFVAYTDRPIPFDDFQARVRDRINPLTTFLAFGKNQVQRVAICSGAAQFLVQEAIDQNADVFLTGETTEWVYHLCREEKVHYVAAGHTQTEWLGVKALGDHLQEKFNVEHHFVLVDNPI